MLCHKDFLFLLLICSELRFVNIVFPQNHIFLWQSSSSAKSCCNQDSNITMVLCHVLIAFYTCMYTQGVDHLATALPRHWFLWSTMVVLCCVYVQAEKYMRASGLDWTIVR